MASATKIRTFARALDACDRPFWVIGPSGKLIYLSAATSQWLGIEADVLVNRMCRAGAPISDDPLDFLAASLSPPPGFAPKATAKLRVQPPASTGLGDLGLSDQNAISPIDVRFIRLGDAERGITLAISGDFDDDGQLGDIALELRDSIEIRQKLDAWRQEHGSRSAIVTAGTSSQARRTRQRIKVACQVRAHIGVFGPVGCGAESVARMIHRRAAPDEPISVIDGPLMDPELLDASASELIEYLTRAESTHATALVRGLDEMPSEAQEHLAKMIDGLDGRLRLIGLCSNQPAELSEPIDWDTIDDAPTGLISKLIDTISELSISIVPLKDRAVDIPLIAAAILDRRRATGEGNADRFSRAALDQLVIYPWPGDFDELDESVRHSYRSCPQSSIAVEHLPLAIRSFQVAGNVAVQETTISLDESVRRHESKLIESALEISDGNRAAAARRLGISRARLLRKISELSDSSSEQSE